MFNANLVECFDIASSWKKTTELTSSETQTDNIICTESQSQHPEKNSIGTQCAEFNKKENLNGEGEPNTNLDLNKLRNFLKTAIPATIKELQRSAQTQARWDALNRLWSLGQSSAQLMHRLTSSHLGALLENDAIKGKHRYAVSCLAWNCSASMLAVAYHIPGHIEWCAHESYLFLWNLYRTYGVESKPSLVLDIEAGCVSAMAAHPRSASVFALGTESGKVLVINCRYAGTDSGSGAGDNYVRAVNTGQGHEDAVTCVQWIQGIGKVDELLSTSLDGRIHLWRPNLKDKGSLQLATAFIIVVADLPKSLSVKANTTSSVSSKKESPVGIVSCTFNWEDQTTFVVGCHGGALFQCSLLATTRTTKAAATATGAALASSELTGSQGHEVRSPIVLSYMPHRAHVRCVQFARTTRNTFLSTAADGELRIYSLLAAKPLAVIHSESSLLSAAWSLTRPGCIYALQEDGLLVGYWLKENRLPTRPSFVVPLTRTEVVSASSSASSSFLASGSEHRLLRMIALNEPERRDQLAASNGTGDTCIWDLANLFPAGFES